MSDNGAPEVVEETGTELVRAEPAPAVALSVVPELNAGDLVKRLTVIRDAAERAMVEGVDYGRIPGVEKPSLWKPGAEKLAALFQLDPQIECVKHWGPGAHLTVEAKGVIYSAVSGARLGSGEGMATSQEKKHGKRRQERVCPHCGEPAVIKGKQEFGGGWLCWKRKDGCGAKWPDGAEEIESQEVGEIENPDLPDTWNTVVKMARKRALVDAVLLVTGASAIFTQDLEDRSGEPPPTAQAEAETTTEPIARRPTAKPPEPTARPASAAQRGKLNAKAAEAELCPSDYANVILTAAGQSVREFESEDQAQQFVNRQLDRLPARLVDPILKQIERTKDGAKA